MSTLRTEIAETLLTLSEEDADAMAAVLQQALLRRRALEKRPPRAPSIPRDANGWPIGYWEKFAGSWADLVFEAPDDPPPEPHPY